MEILSSILFLLLGIIIGAALVYVFLKMKSQAESHQLESTQAALTRTENEKNSKVSELSQELDKTRTSLESTHEQLGISNQQLAAAKTANRMLTEQNEHLNAQSKKEQSLLQAIAPVKEQLSTVQKHVSTMEADRAKHFGEITEQLRATQNIDSRLLSTTQSLESTMKNTRERGRWGEIQLKRIVESAGMIEHVDFQEQATLNNGQRPDMIVQLPGEKFIIIDSKVPLSAYQNAHEEAYQQSQEASEDKVGIQLNDNPATSTEAPPAPKNNQKHIPEIDYAQHAKAVRAHIKTLGDKKYWEDVDNSPELVICFLPAESLIVSAIEADPTLLDYAFQNNVALASPITLMATLKSVGFAWKQNVVTDDAKKLLTMADTLYKNLGTLGQKVETVGKRLNSTVNGYNQLVQSMNGQFVNNLRKMTAFDVSSLNAEPLEDTEIKSLTKTEYHVEDPSDSEELEDN